eukprot:90475_1
MKRILLWSNPRSVSTAFERAIGQLKNIKIIHEPLQSAYYLGPERFDSSCIFSNKNELTVKYSHYTYRHAFSLMLQENYGNNIDTIFSKNLIYYLGDTDLEIYNPELLQFNHSFLIRDPIKTIYSCFNAFSKTNQIYWQQLLNEEVRYDKLYYFNLYLTQKLNLNTIIIDADDVLNDTENILHQYCNHVDIKYDDCMLNWNSTQPNINEKYLCDSLFAEWHSNVINSKGLTTKFTQNIQYDEIPDCLKPIVDKQMPYYQLLLGLKQNILYN